MQETKGIWLERFASAARPNQKGLLDTVRTQSRVGRGVCYLLGVPARGGQKVME